MDLKLQSLLNKNQKQKMISNIKNSAHQYWKKKNPPTLPEVTHKYLVDYCPGNIKDSFKSVSKNQTTPSNNWPKFWYRLFMQ